MNDKKRLMDIINLIDYGKNVIDVGTDHGLVPLYLAKNNISSNIWATDISAPSLKKLEDQLDSKLSKIIKTKVTDGFKGIEKEDNQIAIIAGMGGNTIVEIIQSSMQFAQNLDYMILESNIASEKLRLFLYENNFDLMRDFLSFENEKYYDILQVKYGNRKEMKISDMYYGFENIENRNHLLEEKLVIDRKKNLIFRENIIKNSKNNDGLEKINERLKAIDEVYERWKLEN
ncbi:tRNA (adenine(22)-N(1))-methyltransferase [Anaerococcus urinomassiliensis]|uniref:tRNA (adenine(22)-N(1))-methyltransferase n=1 Tax=Anaerococcus urinomassiliensis TaxID=1745712 RepID=UPI00093A290C|nr:class I SAM-dependent methyltransferase [Anaerococcus urinomassiliensis]